MTLTPDEALTKGREYVDTFGPGGADDERARLGLDVAAFLMDYSDPQPDEGDDAEPGALGPKREVACVDTPADKATVQGGRHSTFGPSVRLTAANGLVVLSPADARRFAAGILDAADEADGGGGPLLFGLDDLPSPA